MRGEDFFSFFGLWRFIFFDDVKVEQQQRVKVLYIYIWLITREIMVPPQEGENRKRKEASTKLYFCQNIN